ncbi:MAG: hypothetical protein M3Z05_01880 [Gemmatimonadota bacterium]|nr:hypothetical protein [Gemmatimonadota bacterium]
MIVRSLSQIDSTPLAGVVVQLLSATGAVVAQRLSDQRGGFVLAATSPGTCQLRALRIGFRPTVGAPFSVLDATTVERSILLAGLPVRLGQARVSAAERCSSRADTNSLGFRAWEQARTALAAALSTRDESGYVVDYVSTERHWDDRRNRELSYSQVERRSSSVRTFHALPLELLADSGYVTRHGDATTYAGPDEEVLLSEESATYHCISAAPSGANADSIILRFEPTPDRRLPDIRGSLVLSAASAQLRSLRYEYVNVVPSELARGAGGSMSFLNLPSGGWVIREWSVVTPMVTAVSPRGTFGPLGRRFPVRGGSASAVLEREAMHETRGEIFRVTRGGERVWSAPMASLRGRVTDRGGDGQSGVSVRVLGARNGVATDGDGRFSLGEVRAADLLLDLRPSYADSLGIDSRSARVVTSLDDSLAVRFEIPSRREAMVEACEGGGSWVSRGGRGRRRHVEEERRRLRARRELESAHRGRCVHAVRSANWALGVARGDRRAKSF